MQAANFLRHEPAMKMLIDSLPDCESLWKLEMPQRAALLHVRCHRTTLFACLHGSCRI